jgi:DNA/RNA-binding domain of Phe-tRNA-synthetase-like protein
MILDVDPELASAFPGLKALKLSFRDLSIQRLNPELESYKAEVAARASARWTLNGLKEEPRFRAYRNFFWKVGVDPTKTRPASEALIRRVLKPGPLPTINTLVDSYNLASIEAAVPFGAFDLDQLSGSVHMRAARKGEPFMGIGMEKPVTLAGGEPVVEDEEKLIAVYPYRDADSSKVTEETRSLLLLTCGVPGVKLEELTAAESLCVRLIRRFNGGREG